MLRHVPILTPSAYGRQYFTSLLMTAATSRSQTPASMFCYSSHMLYHAVDLDAIAGEISRVLRPGGVAVHVLPSASWRFWTTVAHYPNLVKKLLTRPNRLPTQRLMH